MRIPCPFCGSRDSREFVSRGDAAPVRPTGDDAAAMVDYLYLRDNPAGEFTGVDEMIVDMVLFARPRLAGGH